MGKATQDLRNEHDAIIFVLRILDKMMKPDSTEAETLLRYYGELVYFLKIFADKCHHGKEENYLFKELVQKGFSNEDGPIATLLGEHTQARNYIAQMSLCLENEDIKGFNDAAVQYRDLLRTHIEKETGTIFVTADKLLDEKAQDQLFEEFEKYEETIIGHGVHEKLHAMIDTWAEAFGVE